MPPPTTTMSNARSATSSTVRLSGGDRGAAVRVGPYPLGSGPDDAAVLGHVLEDVGSPARYARGGEDAGEELLGEAGRLQHARRVIVHVGGVGPFRVPG